MQCIACIIYINIVNMHINNYVYDYNLYIYNLNIIIKLQFVSQIIEFVDIYL